MKGPDMATTRRSRRELAAAPMAALAAISLTLPAAAATREDPVIEQIDDSSPTPTAESTAEADAFVASDADDGSSTERNGDGEDASALPDSQGSATEEAAATDAAPDDPAATDRTDNDTATVEASTEPGSDEERADSTQPSSPAEEMTLLPAPLNREAVSDEGAPDPAETSTAAETRSHSSSNDGIECVIDQSSFQSGEIIEATMTGIDPDEVHTVLLELHFYDNFEAIRTGVPVEEFDPPMEMETTPGVTTYQLTARTLDSIIPGPAYDPETGTGWKLECQYESYTSVQSVDLPVTITDDGHTNAPAPSISVADFVVGTLDVPMQTSSVYSLCGLETPGTTSPSGSWVYPPTYQTMVYQVFDYDTQEPLTGSLIIRRKPGECRFLPSDTYILEPLTDLEPGHYSIAVHLSHEGRWLSDVGTTDFTVYPRPYLSVIGGSGSGYYLPGDTVEITADDPDSFRGWRLYDGSAVIADPSSPTTTVTMELTGASIATIDKRPCPDGQTCNFLLTDTWDSTVADASYYYPYGPGTPLAGRWIDDPSDTIGMRVGNQYFITWNNEVSQLTCTFGRADDTVLIGDWNGDGRDSLAVRRGNHVYLTESICAPEPDVVFTYGREGDEVLVGDWDGDGIDTLGVRRGNTFHLRNSNDNGVADVTFHYGREGDEVLTGDWDGDGIDTFTVRRGNTYYMSNSFADGPAEQVLNYGRDDDLVIVGDWNGDRLDSLGVYRP